MIPEPGDVRRILVRANNWIGDVVMISPAIRALRERFARAEISILARPWVCDALAANPFFDHLIPYEVPGKHTGASGRLRLAAALRRQGFEMAVLFQKAFDAAFLAAAAGIPVRVGHDTDHRGFLLTDPVPVTPLTSWRHHIDTFLEVAIACGCRPSDRTPFFVLAEEDRAWADAFLEDSAPPGLDLSPGAGRGRARLPLVAIHTGGSKAPRAWHPDRFVALARRLRDERGLAPLVVGGETDSTIAGSFARELPQTIDSSGRCTVRQMAALVERSHLFVGSDSGPMHIAGAVGTPAVGIFGPGIPEKTAPRGGTGRFESVTLRYPCAPCRQDFFRECEPAPSGKPFCLEGIGVEAVLAACGRALEPKTGA